MSASEFQPYSFFKSIRDNRGLSKHAKLVAYTLAAYSNPGDNIVWPGNETISEAAGVCVDTVKDALRELKDVGVQHPLRRKGRGGSMARALFYARHDAKSVDASTRLLGAGSTHKVLKKNIPAAERSSVPASPAPAARSAKRVDLLGEPRNAAYIADFVLAHIPWEEFIADEDVPAKRPTEDKVGAEFMRAEWDALRREWRETEDAVTAAINACNYGCKALDGKFLHTDGSVWLCDHSAPPTAQVDGFREYAAANGY
jgi:Helix-turn-helix domain